MKIYVFEKEKVATLTYSQEVYVPYLDLSTFSVKVLTTIYWKVEGNQHSGYHFLLGWNDVKDKPEGCVAYICTTKAEAFEMIHDQLNHHLSLNRKDMKERETEMQNLNYLAGRILQSMQYVLDQLKKLYQSKNQTEKEASNGKA